MAAELTPRQAVEVAASAYAMRLSSDLLDAMIAAPSVKPDDFVIGAGNRLTGWTGADFSPLRHTSGFGYIAQGGARRPRECLVAIRGTYFKSGSDWMTNLRAAVTPGPHGFPVHAGFWASTGPILAQIREALRKPRIDTVHIVGHSLGGALGSLLADALSGGDFEIQLYTFGAPRCGDVFHAGDLTRRLGAANIHRAYHHTDLVPMVPVFPFAHIPADQLAGCLRGTGALVSVSAHMLSEYQKSVADCSWDSLPIYRMEHKSFAAAKAWLAIAADSNSTSIRMSAQALHLLLSSLDWIVRTVGRRLGLEITGSMTLVDGLAKLLYSGVLESVDHGTVTDFLSATMRFAGKTVSKGIQITVAFIQYVLETLFRFMVGLATQAIHLLD
jgi:triacylglycerol lipase